MWEFLLGIDTSLLLWLNSFHTALGDVFMPIYTDKWVWIPLYVSLVYYFLKRYGTHAWWILLVFVLCVGAADFISSSILKPLVARPRPSRVEELEGVLHLVNDYRSGRFGFVSSHAANTMALATLFALLTKDCLNSFVLYAWCLLNGYSRIYLGVHYPGDIVGGLVLGALVAVLAYNVLRRLPCMRTCPQHSVGVRSYVTSFLWLLTVGIMLVYSLCEVL